MANCILDAFAKSNLLFVKDGKSALLILANALKRDFFMSLVGCQPNIMKISHKSEMVHFALYDSSWLVLILFLDHFFG